MKQSMTADEFQKIIDRLSWFETITKTSQDYSHDILTSDTVKDEDTYVDALIKIETRLRLTAIVAQKIADEATAELSTLLMPTTDAPQLRVDEMKSVCDDFLAELKREDEEDEN